MTAALERAQMSAASINDLPDSAFAYIEPGGRKDDQGKTVPRSLRHFPVHDAAHVRNALARAPQSPFGEKAMPKIRAAAKKLGVQVSDDEATRRVWDEELYNRQPKNTPTGGQFAKKGGSAGRKPDPGDRPGGRQSAGSAGGRESMGAADTGVMGYNPATGRGTGYGMPNGDPRVKRLQEALNRLGVRDSRGRRLAVDGKLGPLTTQSLKEAQRRLGIKADGQVDMDLLDELVDTKSLRDDDADRSSSTFPVASAGFEVPEILRYEREWALDDIVIRSGGDGRTVEAYAAVFDSPSEIQDQHGHYMEVIARTAFNRAISHGIDRINVFYHHGMTIHGTPSDLGSVPIGSPVDIRPDGRGLRTVTRFNRSQLADSVLEAIRAGDIRGYSFRGRIFQSNPAKVPRGRPGAALPTVTRTELGLAEYGPTPTPAYADAGVLAVRSVEVAAATLAALSTDERAELVRMLTVSTPLDPETDPATPDVGPGTEDSPEGRSGRNKARIAEILGDLHTQGVL